MTRLLDRQIDPEVNLVVGLYERQTLRQILARVEALGPLKRCCGELKLCHAIQPERSRRLAIKAVANQVPATICVQHRIRLNLPIFYGLRGYRISPREPQSEIQAV